jgi:hypothetical protein
LAPSDNRADSVTVSGRSFTGSGPITVTFEAEAPETATYICWEVATDASFTDIQNRFLELSFTYEFNVTGTFYVRFTTANAEGGDETYGEPYVVTVSESLLQVPNLITPDSPSGSNQVFTAGGKSVPTGAYYYLIKAEGTDGIKYQKKGDINVLRLQKVTQ